MGVYASDQRHADLIVEALQLGSAKGVKTPGEDEKPWEEEENQEKLPENEVTKFRAIAARANYLALDRSDIQYAAKEVCRQMAAPTVGGWKKLKRLGRYLIERPRYVQQYRFQGKVVGRLWRFQLGRLQIHGKIHKWWLRDVGESLCEVLGKDSKVCDAKLSRGGTCGDDEGHSRSDRNPSAHERLGPRAEWADLRRFISSLSDRESKG